METYPIALALLDFVPSIAFFIGAYFLVRSVWIARGQGLAWFCSGGAALVFAGGFLKALWKLLVSLNIADVQILSQIQFILLAPGFVVLVIAVILLGRSSRQPQVATAPLIAVWKLSLMMIMTICSIAVEGILAWVAARRGVKLAIVFFVMSGLSALGMAAMGSQSSQTIALQWIEESTNSIGNICFAIGSFLLFQSYQAKA
jgi:hypothetical protein